MSCVQVHSTCWAHCWQLSETALAIAEVVEDQKHSRVAQLLLGAHDARFKRNRALVSPAGRLVACVQSNTEAENISEHPRRLMVVSDRASNASIPLSAFTSLHLAPPWPPKSA